MDVRINLSLKGRRIRKNIQKSIQKDIRNIKKIKIRLHHKYLFLFLAGGFSYMIIEMLWRGRTDWTMGILGGIGFICVGLLNEFYSWEMPLLKQMLISSIMITSLELVAGVILNVWLKLDIWDYSTLPFNLAGQISLLYTVLWFFLSGLVIITDDCLRYLFFGEEKPKYYLIRKPAFV
jgi:Predicted membrane protein